MWNRKSITNKQFLKKKTAPRNFLQIVFAVVAAAVFVVVGKPKKKNHRPPDKNNINKCHDGVAST